MRRSLVTVLFLLSAGGSAFAQAVRGRVITRDSTGVPGAIVTLLDSAGTPLARALADDGGRFAMRMSSAGRFGLQVLRLGFRPTLDPGFRVGDGEILDRSFVVTEVPVSLRAVHVTADQSCVGADSSAGAFVAWEEARKALLASNLTRMTRAYRMDIVLFSNRQSSKANEPPTVKTDPQQLSTLRPFSTLPPDQLVFDGYVERSPSGDTYFAPDEEVLLSESFATTHCMKLLPDSGSADLLRLGFTPTPERHLPDIRGVLTLDRATSELRRLDFNYVNLRPPEMVGSPGGEIAFRRLPEGSWIIEYWALGLPFYEPTVNRDVVRAVPGRGVPTATRPRAPDFNPATPMGVGRITKGGGVSRVMFGDAVVWQASEPVVPHVRVALPPE